VAHLAAVDAVSELRIASVPTRVVFDVARGSIGNLGQSMPPAVQK
jgi:hypothetical protein